MILPVPVLPVLDEAAAALGGGGSGDTPPVCRKLPDRGGDNVRAAFRDLEGGGGGGGGNELTRLFPLPALLPVLAMEKSPDGGALSKAGISPRADSCGREDPPPERVPPPPELPVLDGGVVRGGLPLMMTMMTRQLSATLGNARPQEYSPATGRPPTTHHTPHTTQNRELPIGLLGALQAAGCRQV